MRDWIAQLLNFEKKFARGCPLTQTPTQMFQNQFLISDSHGIMDILVSIEMIFQALQTSAQAIQIDHQLSEVENPKIPGIQPNHETLRKNVQVAISPVITSG